MRLTRRSVVRTGVLAAAFARPRPVRLPFSARSACSARDRPASERDWRHGLSLFGELKYPAGFKHFDYVNPNAPKGGTVRMIAFGTFDNFNEVGRRAEGLDRHGRRR